MKWGRIRFLLERPESPHWLTDDETYCFSGGNGMIHVMKILGPCFYVSVKSPWGPHVMFEGLKCAISSQVQKHQVDLTIIWETPFYKV